MSFPRYPTYKSSGVKWLGEVPEHWRTVPLKYVAEFINGAAFKPEEWSESGMPIIRIQNLNGSEDFNYFDGVVDDRYLVHAEDLLFGWSGNRGTSFGPFIWYRNEVCALNQHIFRVVPRDIEKRELYWMLKAVTAHVEDQAHGIIGMVHITKSDLGAISVPLPEESEQAKIASFLDRETAKIDALIAEQQRLIELLQEKRQAAISHAVTKGLNPNAPMKDSGVEWLGEVPEHWGVLPCRAFLNERDSRNGDYGNDYYLSLVAGKGVIPYEEKGDVGNKKPEDLGKCKLVYEGDFVINSMNYGIGSYGVSRFHGVCSPVYIVVTPNEGLVHAGFAFRVLENKWFQRYAQSFGNGILAHRCAISWDILKNIKAGIPPAEEQVEILRHLDEETRRYEQLIATALQQVSLL